MVVSVDGLQVQEDSVAQVHHRRVVEQMVGKRTKDDDVHVAAG